MDGYRVEIDLGFDMFGLNRLMIGQVRRLRAALDEQLGVRVTQRRTRLLAEAPSRWRAGELRQQIVAMLQNRLMDAQVSVQRSEGGSGWKTVSSQEFRAVGGRA